MVLGLQEEGKERTKRSDDIGPRTQRGQQQQKAIE